MTTTKSKDKMTDSTTKKTATKKVAVKKTTTKKVAEKKTATKKVAVKSKAKAVTLQSNDLIIDAAKQVGALDHAKALKLADDLNDGRGYDSFQLGGVFSRINDNGWYNDAGYDSFKNFVQDRYNIKYRVAMYYISIYTNLVESGVKWDSVKSIGWTKLKEICALITPDNVDEWVSIAKARNVSELIAYIKDREASKDKTDKPKVDPNEKKIINKVFKIFKDQDEIIEEAVVHALEAAETDNRGHALENICMSYLESGDSREGSSVELLSPDDDPDSETLYTEEQVLQRIAEAAAITTADDNQTDKPVDLVALMKTYDWEEVLTSFNEAYPEVNVTVDVG